MLQVNLEYRQFFFSERSSKAVKSENFFSSPLQHSFSHWSQPKLLSHSGTFRTNTKQMLLRCSKPPKLIIPVINWKYGWEQAVLWNLPQKNQPLCLFSMSLLWKNGLKNWKSSFILARRSLDWCNKLKYLLIFYPIQVQSQNVHGKNFI